MWLSAPVSRKARRVILHIGAPKSGSTAIQVMLGRNRKLLAEQRVLMPDLGTGVVASPLVPIFMPWYHKTSLHRDYKIGYLQRRLRHRLAVLAMLRRSFSNANPDTVILSSEHFYQHLSSRRSLSQLRRLLLEFAEEITVIGYFRRQDQAMFSSQIHSARVGGSSVFLPPVSLSRHHWLRYAERLDAWANVFGQDELIVRPFDSRKIVDGDVCKDFLVYARLDMSGIETGIAANVGLDRVLATYIEKLNEKVPRFAGGDLNPLYRPLASTFGFLKPCADRPKISATDARFILEMLKDSNAALAKRFGNGDAFFDETVNDMDPLAEDGLSAEDVVAVSSEILAILAGRIITLEQNNLRLRSKITQQRG